MLQEPEIKKKKKKKREKKEREDDDRYQVQLKQVYYNHLNK